MTTFTVRKHLFLKFTSRIAAKHLNSFYIENRRQPFNYLFTFQIGDDNWLTSKLAVVYTLSAVFDHFITDLTMIIGFKYFAVSIFDSCV